MATDTSSSNPYASYYGAVASYFANGNTQKQQAASQQQAPASQTAAKNSGGSDNTQGGNASSGGSSWISAASSQTSSDKSAFTTTFNQSFGGITNNQIIGSAGATGAVSNAPLTTDLSGQIPAPGFSGAGGAAGGMSPLTLVLLAAVAYMFLRHR